MMIYSSGMPLLYVIGMFQFFMTYWVDKLLCKIICLINSIVLGFYKTPPRYGIEMSEVTRKFMVYAIFLHLAIGFYMYSNSSIFTYTTSSFSYLD